MFGLSFLFSAALWALPLAGLPVLLHMMFRRKSPVVFFSTIRFIQSSVQKTAARKRVQKWLLLSCRIGLLALLIAAVAQPARLLSSGWSTPGKSSIAAIVVDTSYSMQLQEHQETMLARADTAVRALLGGELANAQVAIFRSPPPLPGQPEQLRSAAALLGEWTPLLPQPNPRPLVDRVASAVDLLNREHADDKWLVVISDFQKREFPSSIPRAKGAHGVLIDLHPNDPRSAGITRVSVDPAQPTPGIDSEAVVDITGRSGTSRAVTLSATNTSGNKLVDGGVQVASLDSAGHARLRFRVRLPAVRFMLLKAAFQDEDDMAWDNSRTQLIETPPRQNVTFLGPRPTAGSMYWPVFMSLDPSEGQADAWSLRVKAGNEIAPDANVAVLLAEDWPDDVRTTHLLNFVRKGGTLILFVRPGLEETWAKLPQNRQAALASMLPSEPIVTTLAPISTVSVAAQNDPLFASFQRDRFQDIIVRRLVPFSADPRGAVLLNCFPKEPRPGLHAAGLLYRRAVGAGTVYTIATLPDRQFTNIAFHPLFLPMMVRMSQRPELQTDAQNVELGQPIALSNREYESLQSVTIQGPQNDTTAVKAERAAGVTQFPFGPANAPGLYTWLKPGSNDAIAVTNVQLPANESELFYTPANTVTDPADNVMIARSVAELQNKVASLGEPQPQWTWPIAIVLLLLCLEALLASMNNVWKPIKLGGFLPRFARPE